MANILGSFTLSQANRLLKIKTPLGEKALLLNSMEGTEEVSFPFHFDLELLSEQGDLELKEIISKQVDVSIQTSRKTKRHFHGYVASFSHTGSDGGLSTYHATLVPWLHFLGLRVNCRVFQKLSVLDIVQKVFKDYGTLADFVIEAQPGSYKPIPMSLQFNESDLAYVSRMLEDHGLYYYFRFKEGRHTMVIADPSVKATDMPEQASIAYNVEGGATKNDTIKSWGANRSVIPTNYAVKSFNFVDPRDPMEGNSQTAMKLGDQPKLEHYEHQGSFTYADYQEGQDYARRRMDELELASKCFNGTSDVRTLTCGHIFEMTGHFAVGTGDDRKFFVTRVWHSANNNYQKGGESSYANSFTCIRKAIPVRMGHHFTKPIMPGPQTAIVVGPEGEEIYCDEFGRIKIQFIFDREGKHNEQSSCWVRVATQWAGHRFGFESVPRVKTEVIVDFLGGDPDRPIVTGALFNKVNMPPWELPANKTQSGILTQSTKGGTFDNANALRFEDKKGAEEVWLHAEKDQRIEVEHDETHDVGNDRTKTIKHDETTTVGNNRTETVGVNETITIGANRTELVGANETVTVGANRTETVGGSEIVTITGAQNLTVMMTKNENVLLADTQQVGLAKTTTVGGAYALTVALAKNEAVGLASAEEVGLNKNTVVGKTYNLSASDRVEISCGGSKLIMTKSGRIELHGTEIILNGSQKVQLHGADIDLNP